METTQLCRHLILTMTGRQVPQEATAEELHIETIAHTLLLIATNSRTRRALKAQFDALRALVTNLGVRLGVDVAEVTDVVTNHIFAKAMSACAIVGAMRPQLREAIIAWQLLDDDARRHAIAEIGQSLPDNQRTIVEHILVGLVYLPKDALVSEPA